MFRRIIYLRYNAGKILKINLQNFEEKCDPARFSANETNLPKNQIYSVLPPWDQGVMIFMSTARQGATAKLQEPEWGHIKKGEMILGSQAGGGGLLYHDKLVFPQNALP